MSTANLPHRDESGNAATDNRSLGTLIKEFRDELTAMFRQEVALARTEMSEKASRVTRDAIMIAAGALLAFAGLIVALIAAGHAISMALISAGMEENALWLGPLIVGTVVALLGIGMLFAGKSQLKNESLVPEKTVQSMKENKEWVQHKVT
jgi:hypothetical protein